MDLNELSAMSMEDRCKCMTECLKAGEDYDAILEDCGITNRQFGSTLGMIRMGDEVKPFPGRYDI